MRPSVDSEAEARVLTTEAGLALLAEVSRVALPGPGDLARWRKLEPAEVVAAALRVAECRRRGPAKFARADRMWLDPVGLEQATSEPVARHKAARFSEASPVVDLCCGIGGDSLALAQTHPVIAVDLDRGMARRAVWNAEVYEVGDRLAAVQARAESFARPAGALVHVDPDRRARGPGRARVISAYAPGLPFLQALIAEAPGGAIKLGPASDFAAAFNPRDVEVELVSLGGECKEATVWFGRLATCRRRATALPSGATWTNRDGSHGRLAEVGPPSTWLFDPDPTLGRSGLLDGFARVHGLARLGPSIDLLTGPAPVVSPLLASFAFEEVLPLDLKRLRRWASARSIGPLEIKPRGVKVRPEWLREQLRAFGSTPATLFLIGGPGPVRVLAARRV